MKIMIVDLASGKVSERPLEDPLAGGRLLTAQLVTEFIDPKADPLGPGNVLVMAGGALAGTRTSTGSRLSVGGKSPLTGGIKEANAGGMGGDSLAALGCRALVFTGARPEGKPALLVLDEKGARLEDAAPYWGKGNEEAVKALFAKYGEGYCAISIGQAGERKLKAAGVAVTDAQGNPFRMAARGGLGAVMGSKGLKAVLVKRPAKGATAMELSSEAKAAITNFNKIVAGSDRITVLREYGTADTVMFVQTIAGLPVRNFLKGSIADAEAIGGEAIRNLTLERGGVGDPSHACMTGCVIQCSNVFPNPDGTLNVSPLEYETLGLMGTNLELTSPDEIGRLNRLCNDLGMDTIEVGAALGVMMEAAESDELPAGIDRGALPRFGDAERAMELLRGIPKGDRLGLLIGNGVVETGKALGAKRIPAVKGQAMSAYDPRAVKGTGVTYATSPQGADHTAGLTVFFPVDHRDPSKAVELSRSSQLQRAGYDALGLCCFNTSATGRTPEVVVAMVNGAYGLQLAPEWMNQLGRRVIDVERAFNKAAGFTAADDRIPQWMHTEVHQPVESVWDVPDRELDAIWD